MREISNKLSHEFKWTGTEGIGAMKKEFSEILVEALDRWIEKGCGKKLTPYVPSGNIRRRPFSLLMYDTYFMW